MKKIINKTLTIIITTICLVSICLSEWPDGNWTYEWPLLWWWWRFSLGWENIYNTDITSVINTEYNWTSIETNPIEAWIWYAIWVWWEEPISWLAWTETEITEYDDALSKIIIVIQNVVNYVLWILAVIAVTYLLIHGFIILTAAGDDSKVKKWLKWVKNAFIAIAWIWLSWIIVALILWFIRTFAG